MISNPQIWKGDGYKTLIKYWNKSSVGIWICGPKVYKAGKILQHLLGAFLGASC